MDASNAGPGELTIHVTSSTPGCGQVSVTHQLQPTGRRGLVQASFTPTTCNGHSVAIAFNGQQIVGQFILLLYTEPLNSKSFINKSVDIILNS